MLFIIIIIIIIISSSIIIIIIITTIIIIAIHLAIVQKYFWKYVLVGGSYRIETSQFICIPNQLPDFCTVSVSPEGNYRIDVN